MPVSDLLQFAIDKAPTDFADKFNEIISDRIASALEDKKIEFAQSIYGEPTDEADEEPTGDLDDEDDVGEDDDDDGSEDDEDTDEDDDDLDIDLDDLDIDLDDLDLDGETDDD
jgi:ribonuclease E